MRNGTTRPSNQRRCHHDLTFLNHRLQQRIDAVISDVVITAWHVSHRTIQIPGGPCRATLDATGALVRCGKIGPQNYCLVTVWLFWTFEIRIRNKRNDWRISSYFFSKRRIFWLWMDPKCTKIKIISRPFLTTIQVISCTYQSLMTRIQFVVAWLYWTILDLAKAVWTRSEILHDRQPHQETKKRNINILTTYRPDLDRAQIKTF